MTGKQPLDLQHFKDLVHERAGLTFDNTREEILRQKVAEVMCQKGLRSRTELFTSLLHDEGAFLDFVNHLTINETYFFREPQYLDLMMSPLVPELLARQKDDEKIKIISAGCSSGEEPYSIAMSLMETYGDDTSRMFSVIGFDINSMALAKAAEGIYGKLSFRGRDEEAIRARYFDQGRYGLIKLKPVIKDLVRFTRFNLLSDEYPELIRGADIIFYRNVSIYFNSSVQRKILTGLAAIMNYGGAVVFSSSETFSHKDIGLLSLVEAKGLFYYRKSDPAEHKKDGLEAPSAKGAAPPSPLLRQPRRGALKKPMKAKTHHASPCVVAAQAGSVKGGIGTPSAQSQTTDDLFWEAVACFRKKEQDRAMLLAEKLKDCPCHRGKAYLLCGCILMNGKRPREAEEQFRKALDVDELDIEAHLLLGLSARNSGENDRAITSFNKAMYVQHSCWMAHYFLAESYLAKGNAKKARGYYDSLLKILENELADEPPLVFFPISFKREDLLHLCRRKLAVIQG
ncbi:MAG: tetratricopeptide repeat protein [Proteobacteria bacterium]|nr:tetratricopeptide repeat protein [Pseudomonadota bacterium]MBU1687303.1 tetratricopeptide repeat protein [Pseudomonadota bacterium]